MIEFDKVINDLGEIIEFVDSEEYYKGVLITDKSAYTITDKIIAKIVFLQNTFDSIIGIPYKMGFEFSEDICDEESIKSIKYANKRMRMYSDTLIYINKDEVLNHIRKRYNSDAKQKKMELFIKTDNGISLEFNPKKKSVSVSKSVYKINELVRVCPNFRVLGGGIKVDTLLFYKALNNSLFNDCVRLEVNNKFNFIKLSCLNNEAKVNFIIKGN